MDLRQYVQLLRRRWRMLLTCALLGLAAASLLTLSQTKIYTAKAQLFVSAQDRAATGDISNAYAGGLFTQQRVKSYVSVITSISTASKVRRELGLSESPDVLAKKVSASAPLDTVLINVSVRDRDPRRAQQIANALCAIFPGIVEGIETPRAGGPSPIRVSVVQTAELPKYPTTPRPRLNIGLGLLVGLGVGVSGAVLRETLDTTVKGPESAEDLVGAPMLGAITFDPDANKRPLVVVGAPNSPRSEAFRQLRTNLQFVDIKHPLRSVVVTSSIPGEGKSTTTCNLAITLAQAGLRVVLVEADLRRPRIADYMGMEGAVGLTSVLLGRTSLEEALQPWGDGMLNVLASGPLPPNPSELLGSAGMQELLRELEHRADIILIDAPPLLPVTDAAVLGTLTSGVVMLIRSNRTRREQVARATATLEAVGATTLGAILNMVPTKGPDAYAYGYGYGYGYNTRGDKTGRLSRDQTIVLTAGRAARPNVGGRAPDALPDALPATPEDVLPHLRQDAEEATHRLPEPATAGIQPLKAHEPHPPPALLEPASPFSAAGQFPDLLPSAPADPKALDNTDETPADPEPEASPYPPDGGSLASRVDVESESEPERPSDYFAASPTRPSDDVWWRQQVGPRADDERPDS